MGSRVGETPPETFSKVLMWAEITYRLSTGQGLTGSESIRSVAIGRDGPKIGAFFTKSSRPTISQSLKDLLAPDEKFKGLDLSRRALGSLLHLVQDSFAKGHTQRKLLNPGDRLDPGKDDFKPGTWAKLGEIQNYHTYKMEGEQAAHHAEYDKFDVTKDWAGLWGAKDAIAQSIKAVNFWVEKRRWEDGVEDWAKECFKYAADATPSNTRV
ncbi:MAG: hypothetical protein M1840_004989 [Geoglossum simile]|nr:MAG: hypothetical protein M1840_004989 [Geoglossum simile]